MPFPTIEIDARSTRPSVPGKQARDKALLVAAITGGKAVPSCARVRQYIDPLHHLGIEITEFTSRAGLYPPDSRWARPGWGIWNLAEHIPTVLKSHKFDVTLLQREMLSTFVTWERFTRRPRVLDIDDAIWVHRRGDFARRLAALSDHVICGNHFLAETFFAWNPSVSVLPTPVDTNRYRPAASELSNGELVVGWLGVSSGFRFLYNIEDALARLLQRSPRITLRIVSDRLPQFSKIPSDQLEFIRYERNREVQHIQGMTVGIMPIDDSEWSRGKCSFKMLLYMACGIPVVVSPFGMNAEVLAQGDVGLGPTTNTQWVDCLETLLADSGLRSQMGASGRRIVLEKYSVNALASHFAGTLNSVVA